MRKPLLHAMPASVLTIAFGLAGGLTCKLLGLPAPWLSGAMLGVVAMLLLDLAPDLPETLRDLGTLFAGIVMGSAITPEMLAALGRYPASLTLLMVTMALVTLAGRATLIRLFGWDRRDAAFASLPGALSAVLTLASASGADMARVSAVQAFRMFVLVALLPSLVAMTHGAGRAGANISVVSPGGFAVIASAALALAFLLNRLNVLAPFLIGGMLAAGSIYVTGSVRGAQPAVIAELSMFLIGIFAGSRFRDVSGRALRALIAPAVMLFFITCAVALLGALANHWLIGVPIAESVVAYAPGGLEAMIVLGIAMGLDPLFVSSHHIARFIMVAAALPLVARWLLGRQPGP